MTEPRDSFGGNYAAESGPATPELRDMLVSLAAAIKEIEALPPFPVCIEAGARVIERLSGLPSFVSDGSWSHLCQGLRVETNVWFDPLRYDIVWSDGSRSRRVMTP